MPTATEFFGITAHNLGPLTTTFTAPSSCATSINDDYIMFVNATSPYAVRGQAKCSTVTYGDCFPSGEKLQSFLDQTSSSTFYQQTWTYFSPGIACPAGWKIVGALAHGESGKMSASGALAQAPSEEDEKRERFVWPTDGWRNILDKSETLVYCCPSGYQGDVSGGCVSTLGPVSSYSYSQLCAINYFIRDYYTVISSVSGLPYSNGVYSYIETTGTGSPAVITTTKDLGEALGASSNDFADIAVATWVPAVPLIYKKEDMDKKETGSETETASPAGTSSATQTESTTGAESATDAATVENVGVTVPRQGTVSILGLSLGVLAGMGMLLS